MKTLKIISALAIVLILSTCSKDSVDDELPQIDMSWDDAFPANCDTLYIGETFTFKAIFTDNVELGSVNSLSIDIHNNFNHHSHSTDVEECSLSPVKDAVNPFLFIKQYDIPEGNKEYQCEIDITIPTGYDEGDYHFFISLTDKEGWSAQKGLSIKLLSRTK